MDATGRNRQRLWILTTPDGRRVGLVSRDAKVPVALSRLPRNWDLLGEQDPTSEPALDAFVVAVDTDDDPRKALSAHVDPATVVWGDHATDVVGPVTYLPRSAGLEELADAIERASREPAPVEADEPTEPDDDEDAGQGDGQVRIGPPDPPGHREGAAARRERFRDRLVERLLVGNPAGATRVSSEVTVGATHVGAPIERAGSTPEAPLAERVVEFGRLMPELLHLLAEVPVLQSESQVLDRLIRLCTDQLSADAIVVWRRTDGAWHAVTHRGLPPDLEPPVTVPAHQPLLLELDTSGGTMLLRDVTAVGDAVHGMPGLRAGSFAGLPLEFEGARFGLLTVSRMRPLARNDLNWLRGVVNEAMAGLAIAAGVARIAATSEHHVT